MGVTYRLEDTGLCIPTFGVGTSTFWMKATTLKYIFEPDIWYLNSTFSQTI